LVFGREPPGMLVPRTVKVYVPAVGAVRRTCSTVLRTSAVPPVVEMPVPLPNTLPR